MTCLNSIACWFPLGQSICRWFSLPHMWHFFRKLVSARFAPRFFPCLMLAGASLASEDTPGNLIDSTALLSFNHLDSILEYHISTSITCVIDIDHQVSWGELWSSNLKPCMQSYVYIINNLLGLFLFIHWLFRKRIMSYNIHSLIPIEFSQTRSMSLYFILNIQSSPWVVWL